MNRRRERVVAAMSGGVDSSVAAALMLREGFEVVGVTLRLQSCSEITVERSCCAQAATDRAGMVSGRLGIPHYILDCRKYFENEVLRHSWREYNRGRTPNPCVICNEKIKFGFLLDFARSIGAGRIATGHYARTETDSTGAITLHRGSFAPKDQSYFLFSLDRRRLASAIFPVGRMSKEQVRAISSDLGFQDGFMESQDACFAAKGQCYAEILRQRFHGRAKHGYFIDGSGTAVGRHTGIHQFTVGQGRKLGLAMGERCWVRSIDSKTGAVCVTNQCGDLFSHGLIASLVSWNAPPRGGNPVECSIQVRYRQEAVPATLESIGRNLVRAVFQKPIRAVTPGQAAVFYEGDRVLGGGWIQSSLQGDFA